jgi:predicted metal-dependent HD superfamily phosphohydrolase
MHITEIKENWMQLTDRWGVHTAVAQAGIDRIIDHYSAAGRHYHTIAHLSDLLCLQQQYAPLIIDNDSLLYAIFFHDIIYSSTRKDNEARSAGEAVRFLQNINYPAEKQQKIHSYITATAGHLNPLGDPDLDYLLDFDLHILGALPAQYDAYTKQIRKEYWIYPVFMYNMGRKKVLQHFLSQPHIYKTPAFREKYEQKARENMEKELEGL